MPHTENFICMVKGHSWYKEKMIGEDSNELAVCDVCDDIICAVGSCTHLAEIVLNWTYLKVARVGHFDGYCKNHYPHELIRKRYEEIRRKIRRSK